MVYRCWSRRCWGYCWRSWKFSVSNLLDCQRSVGDPQDKLEKTRVGLGSNLTDSLRSMRQTGEDGADEGRNERDYLGAREEDEFQGPRESGRLRFFVWSPTNLLSVN